MASGKGGETGQRLQKCHLKARSLQPQRRSDAKTTKTQNFGVGRRSEFHSHLKGGEGEGGIKQQIVLHTEGATAPARCPKRRRRRNHSISMANPITIRAVNETIEKKDVFSPIISTLKTVAYSVMEEPPCDIRRVKLPQKPPTQERGKPKTTPTGVSTNVTRGAGVNTHRLRPTLT